MDATVTVVMKSQDTLSSNPIIERKRGYGICKHKPALHLLVKNVFSLRYRM